MKQAKCLLLLLCFVLSIHAQSVIKLTVDDGLSQGFPTSIVCDEDGFLWIATLNGLNRYDGHSFQVWQEQPGVPASLNSNNIITLKADKKGLLWISTRKGVQVMNRQTGRILSLSAVQLESEKFIHIIDIDGSGRVWMTNEEKLFYLTLPDHWSNLEDIAGNAVLHTIETKAPFERITWIIEYGAGILLATDTGVYFFNPKTEQYTRFSAFPSEFVHSIWVDSTGKQMLVRYVDKLCVLENGVLRSWPMEQPVWQYDSKIISNAGKVYILGRHKIYVWENNQPVEFPPSMDEEIVSGSVDHFGQLWLGLNAKGLRVIKPKVNVFSTWLEGTSIGGAAFDAKDQLWLPVHVNQQELLFQLIDRNTGSLGHMFTKKQYRDVRFLPQGGAWGMTFKGILERLDSDGKIVKGTAYQVKADLDMKGFKNIGGFTKAGKVILIHNRGRIVLYDPGTQKEQVMDIAPVMADASYELRAILEDDEGYFWLTTTNGLIRLSPYDSSFHVIGSKGPPGKVLSSERLVMSLIDPYEPNVIWAGSDRGLNRVDMKTLDVVSYTKADGLNDDYIYSIAAGAANELWLGTNHGLLRFDKKNKQVVQYTVADGLPGSEFNSCMAWHGKDSTLYFGTVEGIVYFNPFKMPSRKGNPDIRLTGLEVNGHPLTPSDSFIFRKMISYTNQLTLLPQENNLAFRFTVMDFLNTEKYNCRYMLAGADDGWRYTWSNNLITYSSLQPGAYTFVVSAGDGAGGWSEERSLHITILSPWWKRWWAYIIWFSLAAAVIWPFVMVRKRLTKVRRQMEVERIESLYLAELEENKTKMFVNIAHEIRTPLTILLGLTEEVHNTARPELQEKTALMYQSGRQLLNVVQQILNLIKLDQRQLKLNPRYGDLVAFTQFTVEPFRPMLRNRDITFSLHVPDQPVMLLFDAQYLQPVLSNLLTNAIKFTPRGGQITVRLWQESTGQVFLSVEDTGIGIMPDHLTKIFDRYYQVEDNNAASSGTGIGLTYVTELLKLMGGEISVQSEQGVGSIFTVKLPVVKSTEVPLQQQIEQMVPVLPDLDEASISTEKVTGNPLVLVVEDNYEMAQFIIRCLAPDFNVLHAINGVEGLEMARLQVPDLIVTDVMMPEMNGFDFCAAIKTNAITDHIPVVMLTARAEDADRIHGLHQGADVYLTKPFSCEVLRLHLQNLIVLRNSLQKKLQADMGKGVRLTEEKYTAENEFAKNIYETLSERYSDAEFGVDELCKHFNMSNSQFHRKVSSLLGQTPGEMIRSYRLEKGRALLIGMQRMNVSEIAYSVGFRDPNYFSQIFSRHYGESPKQYRQSKAGSAN